MTYSARIDIGASPNRFFAVLTDPSLLKLWTPEAGDARIEGNLAVGVVRQAVIEQFGRKFPVKLLVTRYEPDTAVGFEMTTPAWTGSAEYLLKSQPHGTTLELIFKPVMPAGWKRIPALAVATVARPMVQRIHRRRLEALRSVVETHS